MLQYLLDIQVIIIFDTQTVPVGHIRLLSRQLVFQHLPDNQMVGKIDHYIIRQLGNETTCKSVSVRGSDNQTNCQSVSIRGSDS